MFWKSRHLEFLLLKPYRGQLTHLKNAHFINMKKRDLFEWYKDGCTKTCKNFLAWLFFFTLWGFAISAFFHEYSYWEIYWHEIDIFDPTGRFHITLKLPNAQPFFFVKNCSIKRPFITSCPPDFHSFRRAWRCKVCDF